MKKNKKIILIFIFLLVLLIIDNLVLLIIDNYVYAITPNDINPNYNNTNDLKTTGIGILQLFGIIGSAISIIAIIALGIKYMLGSLEEKAQYKKTLLPYFIGAIFVFGATTVASIVPNMIK